MNTKVRTDRRFVLCMGTRPEIIKMAPVCHALREAGADAEIWHIGQHEELAQPFYDFFQIEPERHLYIERQRPGLGHLSALILEQLDNVMSPDSASCVVVQGDTSSAMLAALSAFYNKIPVAHVEAGLRTYREYSPFPEEKNRQLISKLANYHFAPTALAEKCLLAEGIDRDRIFVVGNTVVDATLMGVQKLEQAGSQYLTGTGFPVQRFEELVGDHKLVVVTAHRRENWDEGIAAIAEGVHKILTAHDDLFIVWPIHPNPVIHQAVEQVFASLSEGQRARLLLTEPLGYPAMLYTLKKSWLILTDSGGIQEESITLGIPALVLREETERPEIVEVGGAEVIGARSDVIFSKVSELVKDDARYQSMCNRPNPYGDGSSARQIASVLLNADCENGDPVPIPVGG